MMVSHHMVSSWAYLAIAAIFTWPLFPDLALHLPIGSEPSATVPLFNLWTLTWNANRIPEFFVGYWDAPIFYPHELAFGLSDPMPFTGLFFFLTTLATSNPFLSYNLCLLGILVFNGIAASHLCTTAGIERVPGIFAGALAVGLPWVNNELGVLQLTVLFPVFFSLSALLRFLKCSTYRRATNLAFWSAATYLSSTYFGVYLSLFLIVSTACLTTKKHVTITTAKSAGLGAAVYLLLLLPVLTGQFESTTEYSRKNSVIAKSSAVPEHFLKLRSRLSNSDLLPWIDNKNFIDTSAVPQRLYPGTVLSLLAIIGLIAGLRKRSKRRLVVCFTIVVMLAFALSLGPHFNLLEFSPYNALRKLYPGFSQMRSPFRLAVFMQIGMVLLAGLALNHLWNLYKHAGRILTVGIVTVGLIEVLPPAQHFSPDLNSIYTPWLVRVRDLPPGPVAYLPPSPSGSASDFQSIVVAMLQGLEFEKPLLNGYSGYFPSENREFRNKFRHPKITDIDYLRERKTQYVLLDRNRASKATHAMLAQDEIVKLLFETESISVYEFQ